jgi:hypothetical protein
MRVIYDRETDTLTVIFSDAPVAESDEDKPGVILDYARISLPSQIEYQVVPAGT